MDKVISKLLFILFVMASPLALAQERTPFTYSPEGCDFKAEFPDEPHITQRCPSDATKPCYEVAQYTSRADFDQTINVEMTCSLLTPGLYETYTEDNLKQILLRMVQDANLPEAPPIQFEDKEGEDLRIMGTSGIKTAGYSTKIFVSQIWVKPTSMMTIEGEMSLDSGTEGDKEFADILHSIMPVDQPEVDEGAEGDSAAAAN